MKESNTNIVFPKLLIIGSGRHGKDTVAEILRDDFGMKFKSSSQASADIFLYEALKDKYDYKTPEECFDDRANHRAEDRARLAKSIMSSADCYVGMRDRDEIVECLDQKVFDLVIWVDASERLPLEDATSFNIGKSCADIIIDNNGTLEQLITKVNRLGRSLNIYEVPF